MGNEILLQNLNLQNMQSFSMQNLLQQQAAGINVGGIPIGEYLAGVSNVENAVSSNHEQKVSGIQGLINMAVSLVNKIGAKEASAAASETAKNSKETQKTNAEIAQQKQELTSNFERIGEQINQESEVIQAAKDEIDTASKKLQEEKDKVEKIKADIQAKQQELSQLSGDNSTEAKEKQRTILTDIQGLSGQLNTSVATIKQAEEVIKCASQEVADSVAIVEELNGGAFELQQEGEKNVAKLSQETAQNAQNNAQTQATGTENQITGEATQQAAEKASSNMFTAASAPQLYKVATDQKQAGSTRQTGAAQNLNTIQQGICGLNDHVSLLNDFSTSIGGAFTQYAGYIGDWNKALEPTITGFGTMMNNSDGYKAVADQLKTAAESDMSKLDGTSEQKDAKTNNVDQKPENNNSQSYMQFQQPAQYTPGNIGAGNSESENKFETLKVNTELEM